MYIYETGNQKVENLL